MHAKQRAYHPNNKSVWVPALICGFCMHNSGFSTRITNVYGSQTSSVDFCKQNNVLSAKFQVSMGPTPHLWICECKTASVAPESLVSMGPILHLWICACKTASLAPRLLASMGPRRHLWICGNKTACLSQKITSLYGFQPSPVVLCMLNSYFRTRITSL